jgi:hypothetical protein
LSDIKLKVLLPISESTDLQISSGISHSSNSRTTMPNDGLNRIEALIGITKSLGETKMKYQDFKLPQNSISVEVLSGYTGQIKTGYFMPVYIQKNYNSSDNISKSSVSIYYNHYINDVFGIKIGTDLIYSSKILNKSNKNTFIETYQGNYTPDSHINTGSNLGINVCLNRIVFSGSYLYLFSKQYNINLQNVNLLKEEKLVNRFYTTFSCKYFINKTFALEVKSYLYDFGSAGISLNF